MVNYLHHHPEFADLIRIVAREQAIDPALIEKDYWIMHCLFGLQQAGMTFELKGGTSLSKGYGIIHRFSEDIDIRIEPPKEIDVAMNRNQDKPAHRESRKHFYDWLAQTIQMDGISEVQRDIAFDDEKYRSGGIRLIYNALSTPLSGLKNGILLEVGFDDITPNEPKTISSWAYDFAEGKLPIFDNRAKAVFCYHPGYTLVEKLQTISTKFRKQQSTGDFSENFMRHYYDVYCLLQTPEVQTFIGTQDYQAHKGRRFRKGDNLKIQENEAFILENIELRKKYEVSYKKSRSLYYKGQPEFNAIMNEIQKFIHEL
jgi:hypothetical protein